MAGRRSQLLGGIVLVTTSVVAVACNDDKVVDTTPTTTALGPSGSTTSPFGRPGSHDASVQITYTITGDGSGPDPAVDLLAELEEKMVDAIEPSGIGEIAADDFGEGTVTINLYGPDLDALWNKVEPIARTYPGRPAYAELRDGGPDQPATRIDLGEIPTTTGG